MRPQPESSNQEVLAGLVERVTYHNSENGFCVLRAKVRGHRDVVTVVGHAATIAGVGTVRAVRIFKTYGAGIEKYLSSGMIRGVGPVYAKKLVRALSVVR